MMTSLLCRDTPIQSPISRSYSRSAAIPHHKIPCRPCHRAARVIRRAAAAAAPTVAAALSTSTLSWTFSICTAYSAMVVVLVCCNLSRLMITLSNHSQMVLLPATRAVRQTIERGVPLLPLVLCYGILLAHSWQPDTLSLLLPGSLSAGLSGGFNPQFFPSLSGIGQLFARVVTAASLWVHLLAINLFAARQVYLDGVQRYCHGSACLILAIHRPAKGCTSCTFDTAVWGGWSSWVAEPRSDTGCVGKASRFLNHTTNR